MLLHECMQVHAAVTCRVENVLHHMDHTICCHQVAVWDAYRVDVNGVVHLKTFCCQSLLKCQFFFCSCYALYNVWTFLKVV